MRGLFYVRCSCPAALILDELLMRVNMARKLSNRIRYTWSSSRKQEIIRLQRQWVRDTGAWRY